MQLLKRIFSILCFFALSATCGVPTAAAESRVNGFFRTDLVRAGVFEEGLQRSSFSSRSLQTKGVSVPLKAVRSKFDTEQSLRSQPKQSQITADSAESPANEWDVSRLYPNLR